jgi:hypothetical protein
VFTRRLRAHSHCASCILAATCLRWRGASLLDSGPWFGKADARICSFPRAVRMVWLAMLLPGVATQQRDLESPCNKQG